MKDLLPMLQRIAKKSSGSIVVGFDFPIGLPIKYAQQLEVDNFRPFLAKLNTPAFEHFFQPAHEPNQISIYRPFFPAGAVKKGHTTKRVLCQALHLQEIDDLYRRCELAQPARRKAECIFWTLGAKQVGRAAIIGWRDFLIPSVNALHDSIGLWPFDGAFTSLLASREIVIVETYPAEFYGHFSLKGVSKRVSVSRKHTGQELLRWTGEAGIECVGELRGQLDSGFGLKYEGEDEFDAVVGLLGMLNVILGRREAGDPVEPSIRCIEGWMLGQRASGENDAG